MIKFESILAFASIAEAGSVTGAARRLAISKSVVSERLTELERLLGAKLVRRSTRRLSLTDESNTFYERAKRILREVESAASELAERRGALTGSLRISAAKIRALTAWLQKSFGDPPYWDAPLGRDGPGG
jgi:DNA-binding transcriptional LysR family regulator